MGAGPELKKALSQRQLSMIAIGGVIGAGLFVGSSVVIKNTGPGVFITYLMSGVLVIMVMRMLAEMAVANPSTGSFADYSRRAMGNWAGFSVGWLYWYFWVTVVGFEAVAGAKIISFWVPGIPLWITSLVLLISMTATNLFSVSSFGEFEYWFAGIKVAAIILFMGVASAFVFGLWPGKGMDFSNLWSHGGFFPLGPSALTIGVVATILSMVGAEIATIAAAESEDPERAVTKAANSVIMRIAVFYVGATFLLVTILPWNEAVPGSSPFVAAFEKMGIPYADHIMNAVVLTAVLSCLNSGLYTASRMLFVLAARREAPASFVSVSRRGVPMVAILVSTIVGLLCVVAAAISPDLIFEILMNAAGSIALFVYLLIAISQIVLRYRTSDADLKVKMWLFPVLSILTVLGILYVLLKMYLDEGTRNQLLLSLGAWALVLVLFGANKLYIRSRPVVEGAVATKRPHRVLVMANQTVESSELLDELRRIGADNTATYYVVVPASPIETGVAATHGPLDVAEATKAVAQQRLAQTLATLRSENVEADGALGDYRPLRALANAVDAFHPDQIVISTLPLEESVWHRFEVVDRARAEHPNVPVTHVVATPVPAGQSA